MQEPYGEGVASHTGPESCVSAREGGGEALTGVQAGWVRSRETPFDFGVPTPFLRAEGHTGPAAKRGVDRAPRGQRPHARLETLHTEAGRSHIRPWMDDAGVRGVNPQGARRR
jgi:hypothetical protein